jgi:signal transduction histidine kinase
MFKGKTMVRVIIWLLLSLISCGGLVNYALQQQYEKQSEQFRILYRDVSVKLAQNDVILSLLSAHGAFELVQQRFPQVIRWEPRPTVRPAGSLVSAGNGQYWLSGQHYSLLIDLNPLLDTLLHRHRFQAFSINWQQQALITRGDAGAQFHWRWDKKLASPSQPFVLSAGNDPDWRRMPWLVMLAALLFWAAAIYFISQYRRQKRQRELADLRARFSELTRLNALGEIAAGLAHELNQPLTATLSYNQAALRLINQQQPQHAAPLLDAAVVQIKRVAELIQVFRQRLSSEQIPPQPVNLGRIWRHTAQLLETELRQGKVKSIVRIPDDLPAVVAVPLYIEQILHNLLSNAIQAQQGMTTGEAWVAIAARQERDGVAIEVSDGGPGLSEQALEQVFMPFFTTREQGLGLGMALTETLVQRLNGTISVRNITGQGACFTVWLPLKTTEA